LHRLSTPPASPLFPYTTLFRSGDHPSDDGRLLKIFRPKHGHVRQHEVEKLRHDGRDASEVAGPRRAFHALRKFFLNDVGAVTALDRKSTRLNSSHVSISYAVFC